MKKKFPSYRGEITCTQIGFKGHAIEAPYATDHSRITSGLMKEEGEVNTENWNWEPGEKLVHDFGSCSAEIEWIEEPQASPDGERIAAAVKLGEEEFTMCVNGEPWEAVYERCWFPKFSPDGRLTALVTEEGMPTLAVEGTTWENTYDFIWDTQFSSDGSVIAAAAQMGMKYGMSVDDTPWDQLYTNANHFTLSPDGATTAAAVQVEDLAQADILKFQEGIFSIAVNGKAWNEKFVDCWNIRFNTDATKVAAEVRTTLFDYTIAVDGVAWKETFASVWEPIFNPATGAVVAPVRIAGKWSLAQNGTQLWDRAFIQCWHQFFSPDGQQLAAIVSPKFGRWTIALNGTPWSTTYGDLVTDAGFSPDGSRIAALGKENGKWSVCVDDKTWSGKYDMAYAPVFSPDSGNVAALVEENGGFTVAVNGREYPKRFETAWSPVFSPDSKNVLVRCIENGKYYRRIVPVADFAG